MSSLSLPAFLPTALSAQNQFARYEYLARFQIEHQYFNGPYGAERARRAFEIRPTEQSQRFMKSVGLVARPRGAGIDIFIATDAYDRLRAGYTDYATWLKSAEFTSLTFEVFGQTPELFIATAPQPGFTESEEFWLMSDRLADSQGALEIFGIPRTSTMRYDQVRLGQFALRFAAPGGPLAGLFSTRFPQINARTYSLRLKSRMVRRRYFIAQSNPSDVDLSSLLISDSSNNLVLADFGQATMGGQQFMTATLQREEPLRAEMTALNASFTRGTGSMEIDLPGPLPNALQTDGEGTAIAEIYVYL
ncbi:MAG: hypothetical protein AAF687_12745 [Pseudomonadota bacterium]